MFAPERCDNLARLARFSITSQTCCDPQAKENSRQFWLLRTDILQKTVVGCPAVSRLKDLVSQAIRFLDPILLILCLKILANKQLNLDRRYCLPLRATLRSPCMMLLIKYA